MPLVLPLNMEFPGHIHTFVQSAIFPLWVSRLLT